MSRFPEKKCPSSQRIECLVSQIIEMSRLLSGKRDTLSSGNRTTYPLGNILWESDHLSFGKHPVGIGNLGDGFQPSWPNLDDHNAAHRSGVLSDLLGGGAYFSSPPWWGGEIFYSISSSGLQKSCHSTPKQGIHIKSQGKLYITYQAVVPGKFQYHFPYAKWLLDLSVMFV